MKRFILTLSTTLLFSVPILAQTTDDQVLNLIRQADGQGLGQSEITRILMQRGVTQEQLLRVLGKTNTNSNAGSDSRDGMNSPNRLRVNPNSQRTTNLQQQTTDSKLSAGQRQTTDRPWEGDSELTWDSKLIWDSIPVIPEEKPGNKIFGHDIFNNKQLTFEPSLNIATPANYLLGPGDEVIIDIWGESEQTLRQQISPDGMIVIPRLGPVQLNGFTVQQADARLRQSLSRIYSSMEGEQPATFVKLSLGQIRSIQVHVMGEVVNPGTYTVSSLASLFHVLYSAGGVNDIGSLRGIEVSRDGRRIARVDVYSYLLEGKTDSDIALKDGDAVVVPPYQNMVGVTGNVKRPMRYETREGETLSSLLGFAGGFTGDAYRDAVTLVRRSGRLQEVHNVGRSEYDRFRLADGDSIAVGGIIERFRNRLEITGAVFRPGLYAVSDSVSTIRQLIGQADGLMGDAFGGHAILTREKPDYTFEVFPVDVGSILTRMAPDIVLRNNDRLHIPSISDLREEYKVDIQGAVRLPGEYEYADNLSIEDVIVMAGGLLESASTVRVDVFRRIKNPTSLAESDMRSESFSFPIRDGLVVSGDNGFHLQPFDIVTIRTSPGYEAQKNVAILGEILFPGDYTLIQREERLSDLMRMSGGALSSAYLRGASLVRQKTENEESRTRSAFRLTELGGPDSLSMNSLNIAETYTVGIELEKAITQPGSDYDLVLQEGDMLYVPGYVGTVSISGAVLSPNTVSYREGMRIGQYIDQAGGYAHRARRGARIVIHMNGTIARVKPLSGVEITPGSEIVVPYRSNRTNRVSVAEVLSLSASTISSASLVTSIINSLK